MGERVDPEQERSKGCGGSRAEELQAEREDQPHGEQMKAEVAHAKGQWCVTCDVIGREVREAVQRSVLKRSCAVVSTRAGSRASSNAVRASSWKSS